MSLTREAYQALEDIVGSEYITENPEVLDTYCFVWGNELMDGDKFSARPHAVIMPETVEEIQAIVRVCNRYKVQYKAFATGFEVVALTAAEPFLPIDLRRMNRIIEIDEKNRIAVVEPYVSQAELLIETIKKGLRPNVIGAGPSSSVVAGTAAHFGSGPQSISTDYGGRNLLGVEWVLPDGEILRLGSLGCDAGWINGDGPGISLRGVLRGYGGATGGLGIFTKVATKLYPHYGPDKFEVGGCAPNYEMKLPEGFSIHLIMFPGTKEMKNFFHLIHEEAICFGLERPGMTLLVMFQTETNTERAQAIDIMSKEDREAASFSLIVGLDASSEREMEYRKKVLEMIIDQTGATEFPLGEKESGMLFNSLMTAQGMTRGAFRMTGSFALATVGEESIDSSFDLVTKAFHGFLKDAMDSGKIFSFGAEACWQVIYGDGVGHSESIVFYDPADRESTRMTAECLAKGDEMIAQWRLGINSLENALSYDESALKAARPHLSHDFVKYIRKIKAAFDPNLLSESSFYVSGKEYG
jgi:glycolate oxidase